MKMIFEYLTHFEKVFLIIVHFNVKQSTYS